MKALLTFALVAFCCLTAIRASSIRFIIEEDGEKSEKSTENSQPLRSDDEDSYKRDKRQIDWRDSRDLAGEQSTWPDFVDRKVVPAYDTSFEIVSEFIDILKNKAKVDIPLLATTKILAPLKLGKIASLALLLKYLHEKYPVKPNPE